MEEYWKSEILKLYGHLENIAKSRDNENVEDPVKPFTNFFKDKETEGQKLKLGYLTDEEFIKKGTVSGPQKMEIEAKWKHDCNLNGDSLLLRAMSKNFERNNHFKETLDNIIQCLISNCPALIRFENMHENSNGVNNGVTPLHLAIVHEDKELLQNMADKLSQDVDSTQVKVICAVGAEFQDTEMMAGTLLGVATLKFNEEIFCIILKHFDSEIGVTNKKDDNIIHSLIKYAHMHREKLQHVLNMVRFILDYEFIDKGNKYECERKKHHTSNEEKHLFFSKRKWDLRKQTRKLLMMKNKEKLTPLQLAAKRQQFEIFKIIINHEVYNTDESTYGLFNEVIYDITEIETLSIESDINASHEENIKSEHHESVLEYVVHHQTKNAFLFANVSPVKEVISEKWKYYRPWFLTWFAFHLIFMVLLSYAAVLRSKVTGTSENTSSVQVRFEYHETNDCFVSTISLLGFIFAVLIVSVEVVRTFSSRFKSQTSSNFKKRIVRHFCLPYSNFMFRIYFILFSLLLTVDFIVVAIMASGYMSGYDNYCLLFAVIIGWYLVLFFLQVFKVFSFYTVLIQRVILDMLKFAFVMGIFLISFSIAMFMVLQGANTEDEDFNHLGKTMVKMLTIMLGIGDIDILFQAKQPVLAVIVFVLFVLLTTILLLNALIAMMSNSCTDLMSNNVGVRTEKMHYRLQKLSVILFLESFLPRRFCKTVGYLQKKEIYDNESNKYQEKQRRHWKRNSIHDHVQSESDMVDEPLQLTHHSIIEKNIPRQHKSRNKKTYKSSKVGPEFPERTTVSNLQREQLARLDITDIGYCRQCQKEYAILT